MLFRATLFGRRALRTVGRSASARLSTEAVLTTERLISIENEHVAHNYHPLPIVFARAEGARVWDPEGREYLDFLSAYSAVNQGHCHPAIIAAAEAQLRKVTLTSRAFHNDQLPHWAAEMKATFGYDSVLPMNTGAEAVETAVKLSRRWGYLRKGVRPDEAVVLHARDSFHGRTLAAISMSTDPTSTDHHGPLAPGFESVPFADPDALRLALHRHKGRVVAFVVEPIQGEAGVIVPPLGYLQRCREACEEHGALLVADEVQTGIGRTGRMLASEHDEVRPHLVVLGKALGGGVYPISAVVGDDDVMGTVVPGVHGSTFGGNPLACAVSLAALRVIKDENLVHRAQVLGELWTSKITPLLTSTSLATATRGRGLLQAIELSGEAMRKAGFDAMSVCTQLKERGVLAKPTRETTIRFAPPLVISDEELCRGADVVVRTIQEFDRRCN
ncbi:hypothetical protein AB1Y20_013353 [Prymnesium parvum]|uniref:Ornithine aminotransferase n=1 Tax=Prymnesium parvum TaxID=97485 RepID=A0AB34IMZ0_PRYPA